MKTALKSAFLLVFALSGLTFADQVAVVKFKGLNNNSNSVIIDPSEAQDLLNIDVTPTGQSVKKRSGYGLYKALATAKPMHGGYHAFDSTGNDYQLWGSSTSLYGIVADGTPTQLVSSATLNSTWDCADTQGSSYCVDSSRDAYIKTAGATMSWFTTPLGTMVESTPDRVVVAGVSGSPNTLFVSQSNVFTNFTTGLNATDAFTEVIASPGSKITHIRWGCGKLLWWKDQSFGYFDFDDQYAAQVKTVSDVIGTFDNTSAIDPGGRVWFRGQDGHTWMYDCSSLVKQSIDITPNVQASGKRVSNLWTQTSASDFNAGAIVPTVNISTSISPGDVIVSSFQAVENSSTQWTNGATNNTTVNPSSITLSRNNTGTVNDPSFENGSWPVISSSWTQSGSNWSLNNGTGFTGCSSKAAQSGSYYAYGSINTDAGSAMSVSILRASDSSALVTNTATAGTSCNWVQDTLAAGSYVGQRIKLRFRVTSNLYGNQDLTTNESYILGGDITYYRIPWSNGGAETFAIDNVQNGSSTITTGAFTSQTYNTTFTSATYSLTNFSYTANTSTPTFALQTSTSSNGPWTSLLTSTGTNAVGNQYVRYITTITITASDNSALTYISSASILARSTGTYYSQVHNAPNLNGWSTLGVTSQNNGGTQTFYMRSSTNSFTTLSSTPSWTSQTAGGLITISTGTYFQFRDDFALTAATHTPTLSDFTVNWFEGSATDQAYMLYFDNAIWESVAYGAGQATNNYIFKFDLINDGWTLYNFGAGGMLAQANTLYFGDTSAGNVFNYGSATSDNGTAIQSYWRSKSFTGADPFLQSSLSNIDVFAKKDQGTTLTATYTMDTSTSTAYSIVLSTANAITQSRKLLPPGKNGYVFDLKLGDTSASSAWEVLGYRIGFTQQPYRPTTP